MFFGYPGIIGHLFQAISLLALTFLWLAGQGQQSSGDGALADSLELEEVVISATRTEKYLRDIPMRISLVTPLQVKALPVQYTDEFLHYVPGVMVSRPFGIFSSKSTVTMRGLDGKEQGRVLVLLDGVPLNKADGGSVNWNLIDPAGIARIEVIKGPGSSVYGGNAMGGSVNVVTKRPQGKLGGMASFEYGTYNTLGGRIALAGRLNDSVGKGFYWGITGRYLQSDGYITQSEADQQANPYIVKSNMKEWTGGIKLGYDLTKNNYVEVDFIRFNDRQGTGEKIYQPEGNTTDHDTYHLRARYHGDSENSSWNVSLFYFNEHYKRVNEFMRDDYTLYDVFSERIDIGGLTNFTHRFGQHHRVTAGLDMKLGGVDAEDVYYTSTDVVYNRGKMNTAGLFLQDEISLLNDRFNLVASLRFDHARYHDGAFLIETPSGETSFMWQYQDSAQASYAWQALSPRLSAQYTPTPTSRIYASYARGFRPSVLDDLCRSGRMRGGFKVANSDLEPETLDNFEIGGDAFFFEKLLVSASAYYSLGKDFIYYVNSGDSIDMGFGDRPIFIPQNITGVEIYGIEAELTYEVLPGLKIRANYAYAHSTISDYQPGEMTGASDLTGNFLIDVPQHMASATAFFINRFANVSLACKFTGKRWVNDQNVYDEIVGSDQYPAYTTLDARLWRDFRHWFVELTIQNILDTKYYDSKGSVCPGRFATLLVGAKL